jgi:hypothetical protein
VGLVEPVAAELAGVEAPTTSVGATLVVGAAAVLMAGAAALLPPAASVASADRVSVKPAA